MVASKRKEDSFYAIFWKEEQIFFLRLRVREMISDKCIVVYFPIILDACIYDSLVLQSARQLLRTESGALIPSLCTEKAF